MGVYLNSKRSCTLYQNEALGRIGTYFSRGKDSREPSLGYVYRLGEERDFAGKILAVGISYNRKEKRHSCRVEAIEALLL